MKKQILLGGASLVAAASTALAADSANSNRSLAYDQNQNQAATPNSIFYKDSSQLYQAQEVSLDLFGTDALDKHTIDHPSGHRIRHDSRLGAGIGVNYFFLRYLGVGGEAYSEDTRHNFVDNVSGSLIFRLPIGETGLAPYAFGGGGHQFDPVIASFGHVGGGLEYRFIHNVGIFVDARWVWTDHDRDYGLGRAGVRVAF
jgi:opacity protein-like surface antigen